MSQTEYWRDQAMTPGQFLTAMERIRDNPEGDEEQNHIEADDIMCAILERLGYADGVKLFREMHKWYA